MSWRACQCGNHTNQCIFSVKAFKRSGGITGGICLACQHHTEGSNCDQCIIGYYRDPNLTIGNEHECRGCDCNLHSNSCVFSNQLYLMSMKVSGGVCQDCQHNTVGRRCHNCVTGYYRDWTKPVSHDQVCLECRCHPIGSIANQHCDRKTGQCPCKPGVVGQACNRCQEGYKQTRLPDSPCIKGKNKLN
uniref:Netrin-1 n=1 Tax=Schistosoma haematobium TaxID=6185 RepID=A0A094ZJY3_SCHHA